MKRILSLVLAAVFFLSMATTAFAAEVYEISEQITEVKEIGTEFYPYVKTYAELNTLKDTQLAKEIRAAVFDKHGTGRIIRCIVGEGLFGGEDYYFILLLDPDKESISTVYTKKSGIGSSIERGNFFCVCLPVVPATGDNTPVALMASALALSGIALVLLRRKRA